MCVSVSFLLALSLLAPQARPGSPANPEKIVLAPVRLLPGVLLQMPVVIAARPKPVEFEVTRIAEGLESAHPLASTAEGGVLLIDTTAELVAFQRLHDPGAPLPKLDLGKRIVLVAFLGIRPTTGPRIAVKSVTSRGGRLQVSTLETQPGPNCIVPSAATSPFQMVSLPRVDDARLGRVIKSLVTQDCP